METVVTELLKRLDRSAVAVVVDEELEEEEEVEEEVEEILFSIRWRVFVAASAFLALIELALLMEASELSTFEWLDRIDLVLLLKLDLCLMLLDSSSSFSMCLLLLQVLVVLQLLLLLLLLLTVVSNRFSWLNLFVWLSLNSRVGLGDLRIMLLIWFPFHF